MTAWAALLAASSLSSGTAWQLLNSPRQGSGVVVNDGIAAEVAAMEVVAEMQDAPTVAEVLDTAIDAVVTVGPIEVEISE
jgi:hypothetical protein